MKGCDFMKGVKALDKLVSKMRKLQKKRELEAARLRIKK